MDAGVALSVIAHAGDHGHGDPIALGVIAILAMVIPLVLLALIGRAFWRAYKRDMEEPP